MPRGVCMYLPVVTREIVDSCIADRLGDVAQDHRLHGFVAVLEEGRLPLHDRARHLEQRVVADLEAADAASALPAAARAATRSRPSAADQARVALVDLQRAAPTPALISTDQPCVGAPHEDVGHDVLRLRALEGRARPRMAAAHQRQRRLQASSSDAAARAAARRSRGPRQPGGDRGRSRARVRGPACRGSSCASCRQMHSLSDARADARRIERLHEREHALDVLLRHGQVGAQAARDLGGAAR